MGFQSDASDDPVDLVRRDRWGRPLLVPSELHREALAPYTNDEGRVWYTRASSLSDYASGVKTGLETWKRRLLAEGLGAREDIAGMIAALPPSDTGDKKTDQVTKAQLDEYIEMATDHAGAHAGANHGTAVHGFTAAGGRPEQAPERMKPDLAAYDEELARLQVTPVLDEFFVACDALQAAGTADHLYRLADGSIVAGDKKTSKAVDIVDHGVQLATYAHGDLYDPATDMRTPLSEVAESLGGRFRRDFGIIAWIPRGRGECQLIGVNLARAYRLAGYAATIRTARLAQHREDFTSQETFAHVLIRAASTKADVIEAMKGFPDASDELRGHANQRWAALDN